MGEPAFPTPNERNNARMRARAVVEAERCDEEWPVELANTGVSDNSERVAVYSLARELQLTADAMEATVRAMRTRVAELDQLLSYYSGRPARELTTATIALMGERKALASLIKLMEGE